MFEFFHKFDSIKKHNSRKVELLEATHFTAMKCDTTKDKALTFGEGLSCLYFMVAELGRSWHLLMPSIREIYGFSFGN